MLLVDLWSEVLGRRVGIDDSLTALGVTPAQRARLLARVEQALGRAVPDEAWDPPGTIAALAAVMARLGMPLEEGEAPPPASPPRPRVFARHTDGRRPPFIFLHGDINGAGYYCLNLAAQLGTDRPFYGLGAHGLHGVPIPATIEAMAEDQLVTLRSIQPKGPYRLGGHCNGGLVAFEMARRLEAAGETVALLVMIATDVRSTAGPRVPDRSASYILRYYWSRLRRLGRRLPDAAPVAPPVDPRSPGARAVAERRRAQSERFAAYKDVLRTYVPGSYGGAVLLLWPKGDEQRHAGDRTHGWAAVAPKLTVTSIPGGHLSCVTTHVDAVAAALRRALARS
ncbi:MAG TPA: thioesterase domain-containing protein [Methylomirabilota bacterium]|nr:thioesterase domain-containing protein [Methylomirabilota bacterium]